MRHGLVLSPHRKKGSWLEHAGQLRPFCVGLCLCKFPQVPRFSQCRNIHIGSANDCKMTLNCLMTAGKSSSPLSQ